MDKEQFRQLFAIAYLASRFARMENTDRGKEETVDQQMNRMSEFSWMHFCEIWPVKPYAGEDNPPPGTEKENE